MARPDPPKALFLGIQPPRIPANLSASAYLLLRRLRLQKLFSAFPDGWPGVGLLILRLAVAFSAMAEGIATITATTAGAGWIVALLAILVGIALLVGLLTPLAGAIAALGYLLLCATLFAGLDLARPPSVADALQLAAISIALVFLGPGAFSIDARLFGRREIIIPEVRRPPQ